MAVPADSVAGIHAKLGLAVIASRRGGARVYMYENREWLEGTLADLWRLASGGIGTVASDDGEPARDRRDPT